MKSQLVILVLVGLVAFAHCLPPATREREELDETNDDKPLVHRVLVIPEFDTVFRSPLGFDDDDDVDNDNRGPFNLFRFDFPEFKNPFPGIFDNLQNTMKRLREQMSRIPQPGFIPSGTIPQGANKTSTTKVIGGHVVTINETTYRDDDPNSTFVFKIRTVDVEPQNATDIFVRNGDDADNDGGEQTEKTTVSTNKSSDTTTERSVETVEDPGNNEIPDNQVETLQA